MNPHDKKAKKKFTPCPPCATGPQPVPDTALETPDSNVGADGQCIVPPHPESARQDTGEPCDDGRNGGR